MRGALQGARSPRLDPAYSGRSETLVEHSSTNTKRPASVVPETLARQAALSVDLADTRGQNIHLRYFSGCFL